MSTSHKFCLKSIISEKKQIKYKRKQKNLFVAKAIEAREWLLLQVKIETKARFLAKRLASEATGDYANKKHFSAYFYSVPKCMHFLINTQRKTLKTLTNRQFHAKIM